MTTDPVAVLKGALLTRSPATKAAYISVCRRFLAYLERIGVPVERAGAAELLGFLNDYADRWHADPKHAGVARDPKGSIHAYKTAVLALYEALDITLTEKDRRRLRMKGDRHDPVTIADEDVEDLVAFSGLGRNGDRNRAIVSVLAYGGLRVAEVVALTRDCLLPAESALYVRSGKEDADRKVPVMRPDVVFGALSEYLAAHPEVRALDPVFPIVLPNGERRSLSTRAVERMLTEVAETVDKTRKREGKESGLAGVVTPHTLRHSAATALLRGGANLREIQTYLGHRSVATTEKYTHVLGADVAEAVRRASDKLYGPTDPVE